MNVSGPSAFTPVWGAGATSSTATSRISRVDDGEHINIYAKLTASDRELIYQATGWRMPDGFGENPGQDGLHPQMAGMLALDRHAGRLGPGQDVTAAYIKDMAQQYQRASLDGSNPYRGEEWDKALAYLESKGRRTDVSA